MDLVVAVIVALLGLAVVRLVLTHRWGPDARFQLPPGWKLGWFEHERRDHPTDPVTIRFAREGLRSSRSPDSAAVGVWNSSSGELVHVLSEGIEDDACWTPDGRHLVSVAAGGPDACESDVCMSVYAWPSLTLEAEVRQGEATTADVAALHLSVTDHRGAVVRSFLGREQELFLFNVPSAARVTSFECGEGLPMPPAFSLDGRWAALVLIRESVDDLQGAAGRSLRWATLYLVALQDGRRTEHDIHVDLPREWSPGHGYEREEGRLLGDGSAVRFEGADGLAIALPWGGECRLPMPPPDRCLAPPPAAVAAPVS